jgi:hypothetical protein
MRVVAEISSNEAKWSEEQIAAEMSYQNGLYKDLAQLPEATQRERSNAIARSHSGRRTLRVQEWYSAGHYRLDQTDEGMVSEPYLKDHPGVYRNSYVNIDDPVISPYRSFFVDHQLRDAQLSKTMHYGKNDLWRVLGLEREVAFPLLVALMDSKSAPQGRLAQDMDLSLLKINLAKAELLHNGSHPIWHLVATTENGQEDRTRFTLRGRTMSLIEPYEQSDMEFVYVVGRVAQRRVCMEASLTNLTAHSSFISKREDFDAQGFPRVWRRTTLQPGSPPKQVDVLFKDVELNPSFKDEEVFSAVFPTNYIVSDVTSGQAIVLQQPLRPGTTIQPIVRETAEKRVIILCLLGLATLATGIALLRMKSDKA